MKTKTHRIIQIGLIAAIILAFIHAVHARPTLENYPPQVSDEVTVSVVCEMKGAVELLTAFMQDYPWDAIEHVYQLQLKAGHCVVPGFNFPGTIIKVEKAIPLSDGTVVYPVLLLLEDTTLYIQFTFIIVTPKGKEELEGTKI